MPPPCATADPARRGGCEHRLNGFLPLAYQLRNAGIEVLQPKCGTERPHSHSDAEPRSAVSLSVSPVVSPSVCFSLSVCLCVSLSVCLCVCLPLCFLQYLTLCVSLCLSASRQGPSTRSSRSRHTSTASWSACSPTAGYGRRLSALCVSLCLLKSSLCLSVSLCVSLRMLCVFLRLSVSPW